MSFLPIAFVGSLVTVVAVAGISTQQHPAWERPIVATVSTAPTPAPVAAPHDWYAATVGADTCRKGGSPATQIRNLQNIGMSVRTRDFTDDSGNLYKVQVTYDINPEQEASMLFYRSEQECLASLPKFQAVSSAYE